MTPRPTSQILKNGLYARQLTADQRLGLKKMPWDDPRHEVFMHRAVAAGLFKLLQTLLADERPDVEQVVKLVVCLGCNTARINTSIRTYAQLNGKSQAASDALHLALQGVPFELGPADGQAPPAQLPLWPDPARADEAGAG
ncbi:MAG TPA: hypothetical protein VMT91_09995 [Anaerolineales bacterium]|nr:hypothetical protein [Anaerolineales bacterium]